MLIENAKRLLNGSIQADIDGVQTMIPDDMSNRHRREMDEQNIPIAPWVEPLPSVDDYKLAIVALLDAKAQERRYDNAVSIATYTDSTIPQWIAEALAFVAWRDAVWAYAYAELDKVMNGQRPQPPVEVFIAELPTMIWPA